MNFIFNIILSLIVLHCTIPYVESLRCVTCSACTMPWSNRTDPITECAQGMDSCNKIAITLPPGIAGGIVMKQCVPSSACTSQDVMIAGYGISMSCCTTDGCNDAASIKYNLSAILIAFAIAFLLKL